MVLAFLFFLTLSADLIHLDIGIFRLKLSHIVAGLSLVYLALAKRGLFFEKKTSLCFILILFSMLLSSFFSVNISRSLTYSLVWIFIFLSFFWVPFNWVQDLEEKKLIKLYLIAYYLIGAYAAMQFFFSIFGIILPFSMQRLIFVRGSGLAHEPSFYALYAIPIVTFINAKALLSKEKSFGKWQVIGANLFLLVSTSTTALLSYFVFFPVIWFFGNKKKLIKYFTIFSACFLTTASILYELFRKTFLKFFYSGLIHESFNDRFQGILSAVDVFLEHPFFGIGLGGVGPYLALKTFSPGYQGPASNAECTGLEAYNPTNVCTEVLSSLGLVGFVLFLTLIIMIFRTFFLALKNDLREEERTTLLSFFISTLVMLVCLQVNQGLFRGYIWAHLGLSFGYAMKLLISQSQVHGKINRSTD